MRVVMESLPIIGDTVDNIFVIVTIDKFENEIYIDYKIRFENSKDIQIQSNDGEGIELEKLENTIDLETYTKYKLPNIETYEIPINKINLTECYED